MRLAIVFAYAVLAVLWGGVAWSGHVGAALVLHLASRVGYIGTAGTILHRQERYGHWTRRWGNEGAYARFQPLCTLLQNNDGITFVILVVLTYQSMWTPLPAWAHWVIGTVLIVAGIATKASATATLGSGAYSWKDFFVEPEQKRPTMKGLYRWLSHPMYTTGYLHNYGFAFALSSWQGILAAAFDHAAMLVFHVTVERPHCNRLFGGDSVSVRLREEG